MATLSSAKKALNTAEIAAIEMNDSENTSALLNEKIQRMAALLDIAQLHRWAQRLTQISHLPYEDGSMARDVLSLYGGMGSLNDLVLYVEGISNEKINDEFDSLRTAVYELCYSR